jgi:hypothetical protein
MAVLLGDPIESIPGWTRLRIRAHREPLWHLNAKAINFQTSIGGVALRNIQELEKTESEELDRRKFENWKLIQSAASERSRNIGGLQLLEVPSRSLFLRKAEFPASKVTADISLDGQRVNLRWAVRDRIGGLVEEESDAVQVRLDRDGRLYFRRKDDTLTVEELSRLIISLADRF